jgi:hypothetical protein
VRSVAAASLVALTLCGAHGAALAGPAEQQVAARSLDQLSAMLPPAGSPAATERTERVRALIEAIRERKGIVAGETSRAERMIAASRARAFGAAGAALDCSCCLSSAECSDSLFCNGPESCVAGACIQGSAPSCNDGDACTTDACNEGLGACTNDPVPAPAEVEDLMLERVTLAPPVAGLTWGTVAGAAVYNVYRSESIDLGDLTCFLPGVAVPATDDDGFAPPSGSLLAYLITAEACFESTLGSGAAGPRAAAVPCP